MASPTTSSSTSSESSQSTLQSVASSAAPPTPAVSAPTSAPVFALREWVSQPIVASFMAGGIAGAVSRTVVSPLERLKILLQVQGGARSDYKMSVWKALQKIWREEGMKGMLAGNGTNCIRIVPYSAVQFGSYNIYKPLVSCCVLKHISLFLINGRRSSNPLQAHLSLPVDACAVALSLVLPP